MEINLVLGFVFRRETDQLGAIFAYFDLTRFEYFRSNFARRILRKLLGFQALLQFSYHSKGFLCVFSWTKTNFNFALCINKTIFESSKSSSGQWLVVYLSNFSMINLHKKRVLCIAWSTWFWRSLPDFFRPKKGGGTSKPFPSSWQDHLMSLIRLFTRCLQCHDECSLASLLEHQGTSYKRIKKKMWKKNV